MLLYFAHGKQLYVHNRGRLKLQSRNAMPRLPNYSQQDAKFLDLFISTDAVHVSGGSSAPHQEHLTVHTDSGIVNQHCC
jgi:hypothetical protein